MTGLVIALVIVLGVAWWGAQNTQSRLTQQQRQNQELKRQIVVLKDRQSLKKPQKNKNITLNGVEIHNLKQKAVKKEQKNAN